MGRIGQYCFAWFPMVLLAIFNAAIRENIFTKTFDELASHQLSSVTFMLILLVYFLFIMSYLPLENANQAIYIGAVWVSMTVCFEFLFGHFVMGHSWNHLLHDYNLIEGRLWGLVLVFVAVGPYVIHEVLYGEDEDHSQKT
ncbi:MAG TPA: hypothetical protein PK718_05145 [Candidatus Methanofastidiosa archaeon]|nr:hypothetical protein [Candidatus Methanofastidiosa archaeon]